MIKTRASPQYDDVGLALAISSEPIATPTAPDFRALYEAEFSYVLRSLRRLGVAERDLEDVVHELFLAVRKRLTAYDASRPIKPWLFGFAYRMAADYRRLARHGREVFGDASDIADAGADTEAKIASRVLVNRALTMLPFDQRALLVMHDLEGHTMHDIADVLGNPASTLYARLHVAREAFTVAVRRLEGKIR